MPQFPPGNKPWLTVAEMFKYMYIIGFGCVVFNPQRKLFYSAGFLVEMDLNYIYIFYDI